MYTLNSTLEQNFLEADGRYLNDQEIASYESYLKSYNTRLEAYRTLRESSSELVATVLDQLGDKQPEVFRKDVAKCKYDMTEVLRYMATAILRDDVTFFKDEMLSWLDTMLRSVKHNDTAAVAYQELKKQVKEKLSPQVGEVICLYLDTVIVTLQSNA